MKSLDFNLDYIEDINAKLKMKKIIDKIRIVLKNHKVEATDFLDPYEIKLSKSILNQVSEIAYIEYGGLEEAERKIIYIFPEYLTFDDSNLKIGYLELAGCENLTHRDYLGAILSLGIVRDKMGDILLYKNTVIFVVKKEIINYILMNLTQIENNPINIYEIEHKIVELPIKNFEEFQVFTSSLRLDVILSSIYNISRSESLRKIKSNDVKINWEHVTKSTKLLNEGDTISLKGFGRSELVSFKGQSKKGKNISIVRKLK